VKSDGSAKTITTLPDNGFIYWLRWSPDNKKLRFMSNGPSGDVIWEVLADGSNLRNLFAGWHAAKEVGQGNWTPDGKYFVFRGLSSNGSSDLWAIRESGDLFHKVDHAPVRLTAGPLDYQAPQPSPDGKKIYVVGSQPRGELVKYDSKAQQFIPFLGGIAAGEVSFSRDRQWISYITWPEGELWRSRVDGTDKLRLTSAPMFVESAEWSPDGKQIAFTAMQPGDREYVYLVQTGGGAVQRVPTANHMNLKDWSTDGNSLLVGEGEEPEKSGLDFLDLKTTQLSPVPESRGLSTGRLSPDGKYIAAIPPAGKNLALFDVSARKWSNYPVTSVVWGVWSDDSKYFYFDPGADVEPVIRRFRVADHTIEQVATYKGVRRVIVFGSWMGLTPDGSPLLLRDTGSQEVYALDFDAP
jgi:Tol biopolymer transport system component